MHRQQAARCWECESRHGPLSTVTLRTPERHLAHVALCRRCIDACYRPLASPDDRIRRELVLVPPEVVG